MNKLLIIGGPTAIGKSDLAVKLAQRYNGIIISADSMQIYKGMDIGTGKIKEEEKCGITHTMLDIIPPNIDYSVQQYCIDAKKIIQSAHDANQLPIMVGGTGLYINSIINEQNFAEAEPNISIREKYYEIYNSKGAEYLHNMLFNVDPDAADNIAVNDVKRTVRALEIYEQTGKAKSELTTQKRCEYDVKFFVPQLDRELLYKRINERVDKMFELGLVDEVLSLKQYWTCRSMQAIGYKEIIKALLANENPLNTSDEIKQNTRRYAKRQLTFIKWIKSDKIFVEQDYYQNVTKIADNWICED